MEYHWQQTEEPSVTTADPIQVDDEIVIADGVSLATAEEPSATTTADSVQVDEVDETSTEMIQDSNALQLPAAQEATEHSIDGPINSSFSPEESATEVSIAELPEISLPVTQDVATPADSAMEKETDRINATENPENALLHTDGSPIAKVQNRPRPRTRKKNNRTSVERR